MTRTPTIALAVVALLTASGAAQGPPAYRVVPLWPQPLPNHWVLGSVTGVAVDAQDHIWVTHRGADSLEGNEKGMMATPKTSLLCCTAAPFVLEFDANGKLLSNFGGPGQGYQWPLSPGGIAVDAKGNVWVPGAGLEPAPAGGRGRATGSNADQELCLFSRGASPLGHRGDSPRRRDGRGDPVKDRHALAARRPAYRRNCRRRRPWRPGAASARAGRRGCRERQNRRRCRDAALSKDAGR